MVPGTVASAGDYHTEAPVRVVFQLGAIMTSLAYFYSSDRSSCFWTKSFSVCVCDVGLTHKSVSDIKLKVNCTSVYLVDCPNYSVSL